MQIRNLLRISEWRRRGLRLANAVRECNLPSLHGLEPPRYENVIHSIGYVRTLNGLAERLYIIACHRQSSNAIHTNAVR